jgi:hypothetical protein
MPQAAGGASVMGVMGLVLAPEPATCYDDAQQHMTQSIMNSGT